ncbi:helix-turn-helix domain-containing protein [Granulicella paludicola]|uniref:helix-turn-helix domain-containing protein n=1 Tax=Granulicella paludicola TaxID=474951 RepID=UPI0037BEB965
MTLPERIAAHKTALKVGEAAELLGCSEGKLYAMIRNNKIPYFCVGSLKRFEPRILAKWLETQTIIPRDFRIE